MKKKEKFFAIHKKFKVYGDKPIEQIKSALLELCVKPKFVSIAWSLLPNGIGYREFYLLSKDEELLKMLPADFPTKLQFLLNRNRRKK